MNLYDTLKINVLIIESTQIDYNAMLRTLQKLPFLQINLMRTTDEKDAKMLMQQRAVDICIVEFLLSGKNGVDVIESLKNQFKFIDFFLLTNHESVETENAIKRSGATGYFIRDNLDLAQTSLTFRLAYLMKTANAQIQQLIGETSKLRVFNKEFLSNIEHEMRTPLHAILGFAGLIEPLLINKQQLSYLESIKSSGKSLLILINNLLELSVIETSKTEISGTPVNISFVFNEVKRLFATQLSNKNLNFIVEIENDFPMSLILDIAKLRQVLINLVGNAITYTDQGFVKLVLKKQDYCPNDFNTGVIIEVHDSGIGITKEQQQQIRDLLEHSDSIFFNSFTTKELGLSITKHFVDVMGGAIKFESDVESGSIFILTFDKVKISQREPKIELFETFDHQSIIFDKAVVLVADDIETNRNLMHEFLKNTNLDVISAKNGREVVEFASLYHPDLIVLDIKMPELDGYQAARLIRNQPHLNNVPLIALSAYGYHERQEQNKEQLFNAYLQKPIQVADLFREFSRFLSYQLSKNITITPNIANVVHQFDIVELDFNIQDVTLQKCNDLWHKAQRTGIINSFREFAVYLNKFAVAQELIEVEQFSQLLISDINNLDIEKIIVKMRLYHQLFDKYKKKS